MTALRSPMPTPTLPMAAAAVQHGDAGPAAIDELDSRRLFARSRRLTIVHQGERYLLQVTRAGKLLLTK
ncbi:hemin uptake protein HemP [Nevskia sp.]|uniref:hemin uptake protein HemP n=1 Tax=Nevskia sp. TaxID=1929292 RepID=UPI0025E1ADF6|nr:hemin uptake protein HemP [Nevskia sp.]